VHGGHGLDALALAAALPTVTLHSSTNVPGPLLPCGPISKYTGSALLWLFVHVWTRVSGSSVFATSVVPGQEPPHRVVCLLSKLLLVMPMVSLAPGASEIPNTALLDGLPTVVPV
jgi:hypothetical protein